MKDWIYKTQAGFEVGILEIGDLNSDKVIFYCHGYPGCRLEASFAEKFAEKKHLRIIILDRAGYGNSTYFTDRKICDFPAVVKEVADSLALKTFSILAVSGGTPYGLSCAYAIPERLDQVIVVSGVSPLKDNKVFQGMNFANKILFKVGSISPFCVGGLISLIGYLWMKNKSFKFLWLKAFMSRSDKEVLKHKKNNSFIDKVNEEAFKQGIRGPKKDFELLCGDWGFDLSKIDFPVNIFHGDSDCYVPLAMGQYNTEHLNNATLTVIPNEGHLLIVNHLDDILSKF